MNDSKWIYFIGGLIAITALYQSSQRVALLFVLLIVLGLMLNLSRQGRL